MLGNIPNVEEWNKAISRNSSGMENPINMPFSIGKPNPVEAATQQMLALGGRLEQLSKEVLANNRYMADNVQIQIEKAERERRKQRKKEIQSWVSIENDSLGFVKQFDDGTKEIVNLTLNLVPEFEIYAFRCKGLEKQVRYVGIYFKASNFWIISQKEKISGKMLYKKLVENGVIFNSQVPESKVVASLYKFFAPQIKRAKVLEIPALTGWDNEKFYSAETFAFKENEELEKLPICEKYFTYREKNGDFVQKYFGKLRNIKKWENRMLLMLYPVSGMMSSILQEAGIRQKTYLNVVFFDDDMVSELYDFLQVFNRHCFRATVSDIEKVMRIKDEVLVFDAYSDLGFSEYKRKERRRECESLAERVTKGKIFTEDDVKISSPVVVLSDQISRKGCAINIFVDDEFFIESTEWREDVIGTFFFQLIEYVQKHYQDLKNILIQEKSKYCPETWVRVAYRICNRFWGSNGIDMGQMANFPKKINFNEILEQGLIFEEDIVSDFVKMVRQSIGNYIVKLKNEAEGDGQEVIYNEEYIWIPVTVMNQIFRNYGLQNQKNSFLLQLKMEGKLITDEQGMARKLQICGKRYETYQLRRELFNVVGTIDIVGLGKESSDVER